MATKASFLRRRKKSRGILVLDSNLASLEPHLTTKNFRVINLPASVTDADRKALFLTDRTLITMLPQEYEYEVPVLEFSIIDATGVAVDDATLADFISRAWTKFRLKSEGYFILRLRQDGEHEIEFPE
jgi:hypothetical protein